MKYNVPKYIGLTLLGVLGLYLVFGLPVTIAFMFKSTADVAPMFALLVPMAGICGYLCYILGDGLWAWMNGRIDTWGLD